MRLGKQRRANVEADKFTFALRGLWFVLSVIALTALLVCSRAAAQNDDYTRPPLRGLRGIDVYVKPLKPTIEEQKLIKCRLEARDPDRMRNPNIEIRNSKRFDLLTTLSQVEGRYQMTRTHRVMPAFEHVQSLVCFDH